MAEKIVVEHIAQSPFPFLTDGGRTIIDERCTCGDLRSNHYDRVLAYGHGPGPRTGCPQYTWASMVYGPRIIKQ